MHKKMRQSEITFIEALSIVDHFCPIKIIFNNCILYNDYDDEIPCGQDAEGELMYGEVHPPIKVVPDRLYKYSDYVVTSIKIEIVQHHHSVVTITGHYDPESARRKNNNDY